MDDIVMVACIIISCVVANLVNINQRVDIDALEDRIEVLEGKIDE